MVFTLTVDGICPKCRKPTMQAVVELHPTNPDLHSKISSARIAAR
jgi:hypothetical protein